MPQSERYNFAMSTGRALRRTVSAGRVRQALVAVLAMTPLAVWMGHVGASATGPPAGAAPTSREAGFIRFSTANRWPVGMAIRRGHGASSMVPSSAAASTRESRTTSSSPPLASSGTSCCRCTAAARCRSFTRTSASVRYADPSGRLRLRQGCGGTGRGGAPSCRARLLEALYRCGAGPFGRAVASASSSMATRAARS